MRILFFIFFSFVSLFADGHIFVYHRFDDDRYPSANTTTQQLISQFEYLKQHNYKVVPLKKFIEKIDKKESIPNNWVALTIDDAYKSFYTNGLKIFKKYNYPFSLYVYVEATRRHFGDFMRFEEIKEASKYGEIGLHSYSHPRLQQLTQEQIIKDTKKAYDIFVKNTNIIPKSYAYPYGEYDKKVQNVLKKYFDFDFILNQNSGSINSKTDKYDIPRIALVGKVDIKKKLKYKTLDAIWIKPQNFPKDNILKSIYVKVDKKYKRLQLYITGYGWRWVKVKNGEVKVDLNLHLKRARTRLILGVDTYFISNKIINKL